MMQSKRHSALAQWLLGLSLALFIIGFFAPLVTVKQFLFFTNRISLFSGLVQLLQERRYGLFGIIATFSVLLPLIKIGVLYTVCIKTAWSSPRVRTTLHWLAVAGKWAMLDVFIVALLVVVSRVRGLADVDVHYGLYVFTASIVLLNATAFRLDALVQQLALIALLSRIPLSLVFAFAAGLATTTLTFFLASTVGTAPFA